MTVTAATSAAGIDWLRFVRKLRSYLTVLYAVILQDMRTRYTGGYLGFLIAIGWPLAHASIITLIHSFAQRLVPVAENPVVFYGAAVLPYVLCLYPLRTMMQSVFTQRGMLSIPVITPTHLILARAVTQTAASVVVIIIFYIGLMLLNINFMPNDKIEAATAVFASMYFGIAFGYFAAIGLVVTGPLFQPFPYLLAVVLFLTSGAYFPAHLAPEHIKKYIEYNPLYHLVYWFRRAYFLDLQSVIVHKIYLLEVATTLLMLGMLGDRFLRGKLLRR